jgi:hypothetical protein
MVVRGVKYRQLKYWDRGVLLLASRGARLS